MDARFLNVVEIGQYFMTKDTAEFSQFTDAVTCREYTLPRDVEASEPKGWIRGNTRIGPVVEVATCCLHCKYGVEIRIMSMNKDNSHSWVRIFHALNKLVTNLNNSEQETSEVQFEEYALRLNANDLVRRSKAKAKPQRRERADSSRRTIPIGERIWTDVEPGEYSLSDYEVSKKLNSSSSSWKSSSRKWWSNWILENQRQSSRTFLVLSSLIWRQVEENHDKKRKKQEKIPVLHWFVRSNLVPPSSSRPFRTQSHWSYFTEQSCYSEAASSSTFIMSDVQSIYIPSSIRDWYLEVKIWATDTQYSFCLWIPWIKNTWGSWYDRLGSTASCTIHA